eukprot:3266765-Rhodomonas_salina.1
MNSFYNPGAERKVPLNLRIRFCGTKLVAKNSFGSHGFDTPLPMLSSYTKASVTPRVTSAGPTSSAYYLLIPKFYSEEFPAVLRAVPLGGAGRTMALRCGASHLLQIKPLPKTVSYLWKERGLIPN